jgi:enduracididine biosynthesis enzyme MppP
MPVNTSQAAQANLTQLEHLAINASLNLADGHARQGLSQTQKRIVDDLPTLFAKSAGEPAEELERAALEAFFHTYGQHSYPVGPGRVLSCYASSVAMEILARSLAGAVDTVALVHPTFDNIPDILRGFGLRLMPVEEDALHGGDLAAGVPVEAGCVFVTTPTNPTGKVLSRDRLVALARLCAERDVVLVLDTSFRGLVQRAHYDHYAVLDEAGCRYVVIEDTGKIWPTLDLKVGLLVSSANVGLPVPQIHSDILLGVSPFIHALVERFAQDAAAGGMEELWAHIADNRAALRSTLEDVPGVSFPDTDSVVSVERIRVEGADGVQLWQQLSERNVYVLPCRQFHWADPDRGAPFLRVALARDRSTVVAAAEQIRDFLLAR